MSQKQINRGDVVITAYDKDDLKDSGKTPKIYLTEIKGAEYPHQVVESGHEENFLKGKKFDITGVRFVKLFKPKRISVAEAQLRLGISVQIDPSL